MAGLQWKSLLGTLLSGAALTLTSGVSQAQFWKPGCKPCCPSPYSSPCAPAQPASLEPMPKGEVPQPKIDPEQPPVIEPAFAPEQAAAGGDFYAAAPNMIGDFLGGGIRITFPYTTQASASFGPLAIPGDVAVELGSFAGLSNAKVAENNSPLPINRVYFRYNHFNNTNEVGGLQTGPSTTPGSGAPTFVTTSRTYDTNAFTFGVEKTFFGDLCSIELRIPFASGLASDLKLAAGQGVLNGTLQDFTPTPANTLGEDGTEFGDLAVILKGLLYYNDSVAFAAGLAIGAPTAPDGQVQVVDFYSALDTGAYNSQRTRRFSIDNDTWSLSPYLGMLVQPNDRFFVQGFFQLYFPLGGNSFSYREDLIEVGAPINGFRTAEGELDGQSFLLADLGLGYWLVRAPGQSLTGLAPLIELHYATALEDADAVVLPSDGLQQSAFGPPQAAPTIGNSNSRVDFLNMTVGLVAEFNNRLLVTTGYAFPLQNEDDRYFDWEFQLQINYRFGPAPVYLAPPL